MKFLVIGHFCFDVVHTPDGGEQTFPGGVYNTVFALSTLAGPHDTVLPVFSVHGSDLERVTSMFETLKGVNVEGIFASQRPTNHVHIVPGQAGSTIQCSPDIAPPIPFDKLKKFMTADGIVVNMVSGFDITLETLDEVRMAAREEGSLIHFDYHNLTQGVNERHERFRRPVEIWRRWAFMADSVQLNEQEILGLTPEGYDERHTAGHLLTLGVKTVIVTRGSRGASLYIDPQKHLERVDLPVPEFASGVRSFGHGDRFGGAYLYHSLSSKQPAIAARHALDTVTTMAEVAS